MSLRPTSFKEQQRIIEAILLRLDALERKRPVAVGGMATGVSKPSLHISQLEDNFILTEEDILRIFADNIIPTATIKDLAVTNAKIDNLAVETAKIALLAVDTAQIADAAIKTAKIDAATIDTLHLIDQAVTTPKIGYHSRWEVYTSQNQIVHVFIAPFYQEELGDYSYNKTELELTLATTELSRIAGFPKIYRSFNPEFKARIKFNFTPMTVRGRVGIGYSTTPFCFSTNLDDFSLDPLQWTVNTLTHNRLGLIKSTGSEIDESSISDIFHVYVYRIDSEGNDYLLASSQYTITETNKTLVNFNINFASEETLNEGDALCVIIRTDMITLTSFITSPVKELVIPAGNSMTMYVWVWKDDVAGLWHFYYGNNGIPSIEQRTRLKFNFPHVSFLSKIGDGSFAVYPCKTFTSTEFVIIRARWDESNSEYTWWLNETKLFTDDAIPPVSTAMRDGLFELYKEGTKAGEKLYVYGFIVQEAWQQ